MKIGFSSPISDGGEEVTKYVIEYKLADAGDDEWFQSQEMPKDGAVKITGLKENEEYKIR